MATANARISPAFVGLAVAVLGLLLALFAYTGERVYNLLWFYVAVLGLVVAAAGVMVVGYDRAIRPELERRRARGHPPPPPFKVRARGLLEEAPVLPSKAAAGAAEGPKGKVERVRMSCPSCAHVFVAEGVRPIAVACARCGTEGVLP